MRVAIRTMLEMQEEMNTKVHENWRRQDYAWYRAVWIECAELMDHAGYKWWKGVVVDREQIILEIVDIWHFGMSALLIEEPNTEALIDFVEEGLTGCDSTKNTSLIDAAEQLAFSSIALKRFNIEHFNVLLNSAQLSFYSLYIRYVGKNILNTFRQDHGYQEGFYEKTWNKREDNEHLSEVLSSLNPESTDYPDQIYRRLAQRYTGKKKL